MGFFQQKFYSFLVVLFFSLTLSNCASFKKEPMAQTELETTTPQTPVEIIKQQQDIALWKTLSSLKITNNHGNIFIRHTDEAFIGVISTMQLIGDTPETGDINIQKQKKQLIVSIDYSSDKTIGVNTLVDGHKKGRVDLLVYVPNEIELDLTSSYGSIDIKRLSNNSIITTASGKVKLSGSGQTNIKTISGDIYAYLYNPKWQSKSSIHTKQGNIVFTFPDLSDLNMTVSSLNKILSNFNAIIQSNKGLYVFKHHALTNAIHVSNETGLIKLVNIKSQQINLPGKEKKL